MPKRKFIGAVLTIVLLLSFIAFTAGAATWVDTTASGSLTLTYSYDGQPFSGVNIRIYHVAEVDAYADFRPTGAFVDLPVRINDIRTQGEWNQLASTLSALIVSEKIEAFREVPTGADGTVCFSDLPLGLYLVEYVRVEQDNSYYHFDRFMVSVPNLDDQDDWVYDVIAKPKSVYREILPEKITYTVQKLWKDQGNEHLRPQSVSIELYRDSALVETVVLSAENDWTYSWIGVDDGSVWQAVEKNVPDGYKVTLEQKGNHFFVTNGYNDPSNPPATGDTVDLHLYLVIMCTAGLGLIVLGIVGRRGKRA